MIEEIDLGVSTGFFKAVIFPTEEGVYKATTNEGTNFYVIVEDSCIDDVRVKWLGENGMYKHGTFSQWHTEKQTSKEGISIGIFNDSLSTASARESVVLKTNQRTLSLVKKNVRKDIYLMYLDLAKSPKVYINVGDLLTDKWIEVGVKWSPSTIAYKNFQDIVLEIEFSEDYIQKL